MEMTTKGRSYVTARGWEDLSEILYHYEEEEIPVDETLVGQYIRNDRIVKEFTAYYDLYNKYKRDYRIEEILEGQASVQAIARAKAAAFDERLSLLGMLLDRCLADMKEVVEQAAYLTEVRTLLLAVKNAVANTETRTEQCIHMLEELKERKDKQMYGLERSNALSKEDRRKFKRVLRFLTEVRKEVMTGAATDGLQAFGLLKLKFDAEVVRMKTDTERTSKELHNLFAFVEETFAQGNEMLILVTELTVNSAGSQFIASFGCEDYQKHNQELMLSERQEDMKKQIGELGL